MKRDGDEAKIYFEIVDSRKRKARPCAILSCSTEAGLQINIDPSVGEDEVPAYFMPFVRRRELTLDNDLSMRWVRERIPPTGRHNLGEILAAHGLNEYSEIELLRSGHGESSYDDFVVREIAREESQSSDPLNPPAIGKLISERRKGEGISQSELARRIGISQPALSHIESGHKNVTLKMLSDIESDISVGKPLLGKMPSTFLWNTEREHIFNLLDSIANDLGYMYRRAVDEIERYEQDDPAAGSNAAIITHCIRELVNSLPDYEFEEWHLSGKQNEERQSLRRLNECLAEWGEEPSENDTTFRVVPKKIYDSLIEYKQARERGSLNKSRRQAAALFGMKRQVGASLALWNSVGRFANENAHLKRRSDSKPPSKADLLDSLIKFENSVMTRLGHFFDAKKAIDAILERANRLNGECSYDKPSYRDAERALALLSDEYIEMRFFSHLTNPEWLDYLNDCGAFDSYEQRMKEGVLGEYFTPEPYFEKCAAQKPQLTFEILEKLTPYGDLRIRDLLVRISKDYPDDMLRQVIEECASWISKDKRTTESIWVDGDVQALIVRALASKDKKIRKSAFELFKNLALPRPENEGKAYWGQDVITYVDTYHYSNFVEAALENTSARKRYLYSQEMISCFVRTKYGQHEAETGSRIIVSSIESILDEDSSYDDTYLHAWIEVCTQAAKEIARENLSWLEKRFDAGFPIEKRIILHVVGALVARAQDEATPAQAKLVGMGKRLLLKPGCLVDIDYEAEVIPLIKAVASTMDQGEVKRLLGVLEDQIGDLKKNLCKKCIDRGMSKEHADEYIKKRVTGLYHSILSQLNSDILPQLWLDRLQGAIDERGLFDGVPNPYASRTITGPNSPVELQELSRFSSDDLISFLNEWSPTKEDDWNLIEPEGLANSLAKVIEDDPFKFEGRLEEVKRLKFVYIDAILDGWKAAIGTKVEIPVNDAVDLLQNISQINDAPLPAISGYPYEKDGSYALKRTAAWFAEALLDHPCVLPGDLAEGVVAALEELAVPVLIDIEYDDKYGDSDYLTASYNLVRPLAITCAGKMLYGVLGLPKDLQIRLLAILESALPPFSKTTSEVVALALQYPKLFECKEDWCLEHESELFGEGVLSERQKIAIVTVVDSFIPSGRIIAHMKKHLSRALNNKPNEYPKINDSAMSGDFSTGVGRWLYRGVALGCVRQDDPVLREFQLNCDFDSKCRSMGHLCAAIENSENLSPGTIERIQLLWDWNAQIAGRERPPLRGSISLLLSGNFEADWMKRALLQEAQLGRMQRHLSQAKDAIGGLVKEDPTWGVALLQRILKHDEDIKLYRYDDVAPSILRLYVAAGNPDNSPDFLYCMERLGRAGYAELDEIVFAGHGEMDQWQSGRT